MSKDLDTCNERILEEFIEEIKKNIKDLALQIGKPNSFDDLINLYEQACNNEIKSIIQHVAEFQAEATKHVTIELEEQLDKEHMEMDVKSLFKQDFSQIKDIVAEIENLKTLINNIYNRLAKLKDSIPKMFFAELFPIELFDFRNGHEITSRFHASCITA